MSSFVGRDNPPKKSTSTQSSDIQKPAPGKTTRTARISGGGRSSAQSGASVQLSQAPGAAPRLAGAVDARSEAFALGTFEHAPVQRKGSGNDTADVHALAAQGVQGGGGGMPHGDRIQQAFGQHDVSSVQAHTGSDAAGAMGAEAYATGNHVAFRDASPSLHTAAHEAAHVVQQRAGVALQGGVGQVGDSYEQHADAVADRVVRGESAASLLDSMAGGSSAAGAVQAKTDNQVTLQSGQLTAQGEGSDAQTRHIHWPNTDASGVTLGKGYDIGSRTAEQVIRELTAAGMPVDQATKVSKGAGLKGAAAGKFVRDNKDSVGVISTDVQYALLSTMLVEYTEKARRTATDTRADSNNRNAAGQERAQGEEAGTFVMSQVEWSGLHPAMVEFLTDLIYQGGYYGWDRVAKINEALKANQGNHLEQFKAVRELFTSGYMDAYAGKIGEGRGGKGAKETWYGQETSYAGKFRRNSLRVAYLNHVISSLEAGKTVVLQRGNQGEGAGQQSGAGQGGEVATTKPLENSGGQGAGPQPQPQQQSRGTQHVVKSGESLIKLSQKFGVSVEALKAANQSKLKRWGSVEGFNAGETITIPAQGAAESKPKDISHVVKRGESLIKLSEKFGVSVEAIKAANQSKLKRWGSVEGFNAGETITIPAGGSQQGGSQQGGSQQGGQQQGGQQQGGQQQGGSGGKPAWISVAEAEIGQREIAGSRHNPRIIEYHKVTGGFSDDETPWCASFANWVLKKAGQGGTGSARALSFLNYGTTLEKPAYGSIAVFDWGGGKGHVGFVVGKQGGNVLILGGNQGDQVKVSSFATSKVKAYVVPPGYKVPASAYSLSGAQGEVGAGGGVSETR
jgi:uncharacterized protein (TIGR02594 family)